MAKEKPKRYYNDGLQYYMGEGYSEVTNRHGRKFRRYTQANPGANDGMIKIICIGCKKNEVDSGKFCKECE